MTDEDPITATADLDLSGYLIECRGSWKNFDAGLWRQSLTLGSLTRRSLYYELVSRDEYIRRVEDENRFLRLTVLSLSDAEAGVVDDYLRRR